MKYCVFLWRWCNDLCVCVCVCVCVGGGGGGGVNWWQIDSELWVIFPSDNFQSNNSTDLRNPALFSDISANIYWQYWFEIVERIFQYCKLVVVWQNYFVFRGILESDVLMDWNTYDIAKGILLLRYSHNVNLLCVFRQNFVVLNTANHRFPDRSCKLRNIRLDDHEH